MSEPLPDPAPPVVAPEATEPTQPQDASTLPQWARDAIGRANSEAAQYRVKVRELEPLAQKAAELEEASKTEAQRSTDRAAAAERQRDEARAESLRYKAAATHGIGQEHFDLLGTGTEEEITARAERLGALLKSAVEVVALKAELDALRQGKPAPAGARPVQALRPGATPEQDQTEESEYEQYARAMNLLPTNRK